MTLHVYIDSVEYAQVPLDSIEISERLEQPSRASFRMDDMESILSSAWYTDKQLADVRIVDSVDTTTLFRGQLTNVRAEIDGVRRVFTFDAEGYDRLLDYTVVGQYVSEYGYPTRTVAEQMLNGPPTWQQVAAGLVSDTFWIDPYANTGIALPATDDASVVAALFSRYWRGPTLTYDVVEHGTVDSGVTETTEAKNIGAADGRLYFGQTTLRGALDQVASLVNANLAFWIDADLCFHWRALTTTVYSGPSIPTGSNLHTLPRMLPEAVETTVLPYLVSADGNAPMGRISIDVPYEGVVDGVWVRTAQMDSFGYVDLGGSHGAQVYLSAPWVTDWSGRATAVAYAKNDISPNGRTTVRYETTADWHDIHVGSSLTLYHPTVGIDSATAYVIRSVTTKFLPDNVRTLTLELGDGVVRSASGYTPLRKKFPSRLRIPDPVTYTGPVAEVGSGFALDVTDAMPEKGATTTVYAQYQDASGRSILVGGLKIEWSLIISANGADPVAYTGDDATSTSLPFYLESGYGVTSPTGKSANRLTRSATSVSKDTCQVVAIYYDNNP